MIICPNVQDAGEITVNLKVVLKRVVGVYAK
jgi:hypothetical protein